jgi:hypothetical protein
MPKKKWKYPRALRMALAEYFMQRCGLALTEDEIGYFVSNVSPRDIAHIPARATLAQEARLEAAFDALIAQDET